MRRAALGVVTLLMTAGSMLMGAVPAQAYTCATVPVGQANPSPEPEPMQPVWCLGAMAAEPTTRVVDRFGGWSDEFQTNVQLGHLNDGDMGYRVYNGLSSGGQVQSRHFVNNNHWMLDMSHNNGGAAISPNQSFRFQNGKLVVETDVAAGVPGYFDSGGDVVWPEVVWSTAPAPTSNIVDGLYLYGHFGGAWASGCRLHGERAMICALEADHTVPTNNDTAPCFSFGNTRVFELSGFEQCGTRHSGFAVDFGAPANAWRQCKANQMDMFCRDRFRLEWSQSGFVAYVNGIKFAEDSGWPGYAQIPSSIASGQVPVYLYFGSWGDFSDQNVYRFHWGRVAVNPHDGAGNLLGLSVAPSYCPGQVQNTCPMGSMNPGSMPAGMPGSGPMPGMNGATGHGMDHGSTAAQDAHAFRGAHEASGVGGHADAHAAAGHTDAAGHAAGAAHVHTDVALAAVLNAGQQPLFWLLLALMVAGGAGAGVVTWLWLGGPRPTRAGGR